MEWPDHLAIDVDTDLCIRMFRTYWQQRMNANENKEYSHRHHIRFGPPQQGEIQTLHSKSIQASLFDDDQPVNINPEEHAPDEEHLDDEAKERQQRFRDEWE